MEKKKVLLVESTSDSPRPRRNEVLESRRGRADGALHVLVTSPARHLHLNPQKSNGVVKLPRKQSPLHGREASANEEAVPVPPLPLSIYPFTRSPVSPFFLFRHQSNSFSSLVVLNFALAGMKMSSLDATRAELGLVVLYLNKAEARDKICRAIQYGSKFISNGQPGTAQNVDRSTTLARKVFRLLKWVNDLHALISPPAKGTPLTLVLLGKSKNALLSTFLFLDQFVWAGRTGIIKNKEATDRVARLSLYCWMASSACAGLVELGELKRLSKSMRKLARELRDVDKYENEQYRSKMKQSDERLLALVKAAMDVVVAIGLLQLAPKKVTLRVTGAFGFITSLISCYQQLPSRAPAAKLKA